MGPLSHELYAFKHLNDSTYYSYIQNFDDEDMT